MDNVAAIPFPSRSHSLLYHYYTFYNYCIYIYIYFIVSLLVDVP